MNDRDAAADRAECAAIGEELSRYTNASRMRIPAAVRWLLAGHLMVFALALEDEEIVEAMARAWGLTPQMAGVAEALLSLVLLALWGALTVAWARIAPTLRRG